MKLNKIFQILYLLVEEDRIEHVAFMTERLVAQIAALQRELFIQALYHRQEKTKVAIDSDLYQKLVGGFRIMKIV
ncbi:MAG: primosomal replication protein PriC [Candidatus Malihini olakiniferum]